MLNALGRNAAFKGYDWARRDPDLALIHNQPEFQRLYPASGSGR